jgi:ABC-2 type transport system permease protein
MSELTGLYAIWYREFKVFFREKTRLVSSIIFPLLIFFGIGRGLGPNVSIGVDYQSYIFPGILSMTLIQTSIFFGAYIVWDRKIDFLKEVLVAPITRTTIFFGKILGGATDSMIQGSVLLLIGISIGLISNIFVVMTSLAFMFITVVGMVSVGLIIGSLMDSPHGFGLISGFLVWPLFFFSGALFPITNLPAWLKTITYVNPITYAVDGLRGATLGLNNFPLLVDFGILTFFAAVMISIGTYTFNRMKV